MSAHSWIVTPEQPPQKNGAPKFRNTVSSIISPQITVRWIFLLQQLQDQHPTAAERDGGSCCSATER